MTEVLIMAPDQTRRARLEDILRDVPAIHVAGSAPTFPFLRSLLSEIEADIAVIDPGPESGSELNHEWLTELLDLTTIVMLSPGVDATVFERFLKSQRGSLLRSDASAVQIVHAVRAVGAGLMTFDPSLIPRSEAANEDRETLTPRESEVLSLLAEGLANREIASRLDISEHTIKFHIRSILGKLGASSRTEAVTRGLRSGLIEL